MVSVQDPPAPPLSDTRSERNPLPPGVDLEVAQRALLFKGLSKEQIAEVLAMGIAKTFQAGETLIVEGGKDTEMYIILKGKVDIVKKLPPVLPGAQEQSKSMVQLEFPKMGIGLMGEMNMLRPDAGRSTSVVAIEDCETLVLTKDAYEDVCQRDTSLGYIFTRNIAQKIVGDLAATNMRVLKLTQALSIALDKRR